MVFILGGSHQGKLEFARARYALTDADVFLCAEDTAEIDLSRRCVAGLERFALNRVRAGAEPADALRERLGALRDSVLIATDISCGVVPVDPLMRAWREACGRMNNLLAEEADEVWRLFCGLPQRLK